MSEEEFEYRARARGRQLEKANSGVRYHFLVSEVRRSMEKREGQRDSQIVTAAKALQRRTGETYLRQARARGDEEAAEQIARDHFLGKAA